MKIWLVDKGYYRVTFEETMRILRSGLEPHQWTSEKILMALTQQTNWKRNNN